VVDGQRFELQAFASLQADVHAVGAGANADVAEERLVRPTGQPLALGECQQHPLLAAGHAVDVDVNLATVFADPQPHRGPCKGLLSESCRAVAPRSNIDKVSDAEARAQWRCARRWRRSDRRVSCRCRREEGKQKGRPKAPFVPA
jgi:hypothetical protein